MTQESQERDKITLQVSRPELILINNAINDVCNGVHIDTGEFQTRLGGSIEEARALMLRFDDLLAS